MKLKQALLSVVGFAVLFGTTGNAGAQYYHHHHHYHHHHCFYRHHHRFCR